MSDELKPCPYCDGDMTVFTTVKEDDNNLYWGQTFCDKCGVPGPEAVGETEEQAAQAAINKCNRRSSLLALDELVRAARKCLATHENIGCSCSGCKRLRAALDALKKT